VSGDAIAIVGMAGRFPGASDVDGLWRNLLDEVCSVRGFTTDELAAAGVPRHLLDDPRYVRAHGWLQGLADFDANFFGYPPQEAALIDPQQRMFLEAAWHAMEDAGHRPGQTPATVGVFAGASVNRYFLKHVYRGADGEPDQLMPPGHAADYLPLRVAHKLGLTGPCIAVQAACASSLASVCLAAQSLLDYRCDVAIAGGASVAATTESGYLAREAGVLSPDGVVRPFDANANGTVYGSGAGAVVLQRLEDVAAGDPVYAVIRGWAVTNDGARRAGFATPAVAGLASAVAEAMAAAQAEAREIGFVEAHGSGTPIGDALEVTALGSVFRGGANPCLLGSVKSNIGNLDAAAGIASLIKAALAVCHRVIPATPHHTAAHPELDLTAGPFEVAVKTTPWPADAPALAGVTSIGLGGTNVHIVLAPAQTPAPQGITRRALPLTPFTRRRHWIEPGGSHD
jgi:acyl transferase domain-containing protein